MSVSSLTWGLVTQYLNNVIILERVRPTQCSVKGRNLLDAENGAFWSGNCIGFLEPANYLSKYLVGGTERRVRREKNVSEFDGLLHI